MKDSLPIIGVIVVGLFLVFCLYQCGQPDTTPSPAPGIGHVGVSDTVFYFDGSQNFGTKLAVFIKEHPELRVVAIAPLDTAVSGSTRGYWVVVEKR
jgi:hypothetical protein